MLHGLRLHIRGERARVVLSREKAGYKLVGSWILHCGRVACEFAHGDGLALGGRVSWGWVACWVFEGRGVSMVWLDLLALQLCSYDFWGVLACWGLWVLRVGDCMWARFTPVRGEELMLREW